MKRVKEERHRYRVFKERDEACAGESGKKREKEHAWRSTELRRRERTLLYGEPRERVYTWCLDRVYAVRLFLFLFLALLSFIRARSVARTRNQPVFSASVCLPQSISGS